MDKKFFIAWVVLFIVWFVGSGVVHSVLLQADYTAVSHLYRSEEGMQKYFHFMLLAHVFLAGAFTWIYARGAESKPWLAQGLRFGVAIALLTTVPVYTIYYVVQPLPGMMVVKQIVFDGALVIILGLVVAFLYRQKDATQ